MRRLGAACIAGSLLALVLAAELAVPSFPLKDLEGFRDSVRILDSEGNLLREVASHDGARARWMKLAEISPVAVQATIAIEDHRFYRHSGVDLVGLLRAGGRDLRLRRAAQGGSTITMQLVRLVHPHPRTLAGKIGEILEARSLERALSKEQILEQYLNRAPYGAGALGIEAASQRYFGKPSRLLSLAEAALLAGLPQSPGSLRGDSAVRRQRQVLARMLETGAASTGDIARARIEPLHFAKTPPAPFAMHFTEYALQAAPGPGTLRTSLDRDLQAQAERLLRDHVRSLALDGVTNAAAVVLDNRTCQVLAMVGSSDYWAPDTGAVNGALARRQPGSALKPFTYALAFEHGASPITPVADIETRWGEAGRPLFMPKNFSESFSGPVLMGDALGRSLNVPAVRVAARLGRGELLEKLRQIGFASLDQAADFYGLGLTLGNGEVTLLELAQGYAMFARGGRICRATPLAAPTVESAQAFSPQTAYLVTSVLSDEALRVRAFGPANALMLGFPVAVKTGTSSDFRDNWAIGYTDRITVAVWSGDFRNRALNHLAGAAGAGPLFHKLMKLAAGRPPRRSEPPPGIVEVTVCEQSGLLPTPFCPRRRTVKVAGNSLPHEECPWHRTVPVDRRNGLLAGPKCPSAFVEQRPFEHLPAEFASWQKENAGRAPPSRWSPLCPLEGPVPGAIVITWPRNDEVFLFEPGYDPRTQSLRFAAEVEPRLPALTWTLDGQPLASREWPYETEWRLERGRHVLRATSGPTRSDPVAFEVR
jgi:penicillin-binding protein 1C